ncbi:hypothetical protein RIVM261_002610 [Rivularia sp. IAM M-261]|nr:hypothetical protein RIVM261_002610 [Rivularia sp. IAM M-261]
MRQDMSKHVKQFHQMVMQNPPLLKRLKSASDRDSFVKLIVQLGGEYGYSFTSKEVEVYIKENLLTLIRQFA